MPAADMKPGPQLVALLLALAAVPGGEGEPLPRPEIAPGSVVRLSQSDPAGYVRTGNDARGPGLLLTFPPVEMTVTSDPAVRLAGATEAGARVLINGKPVKVYHAGSFVALVPLAGGENSIIVTAAGGKGETVCPLAIRREKTAPAGKERTEFHLPLPGRIAAGPEPVRSLPAGPRILTAPPGAALRITGREGSWLRADLGGGISGWIPASAVELGDEPPPEPVRVGDVSFSAEKSEAWFSLEGPAPARVDYLGPEELDLVFHHAAPATETIDLGEWEGICVPAPSGEGTAVYRLRGGLDCHRWSLDWLPGGYRLRWRGRPRREEGPVGLDPGHGGRQRGAVSPSGVTEKDANLALARAVAAELAKAGVTSFLTRDGDRTLGLEERIEAARSRGAGVLVSLHHNSVGDARDPLSGSGYTIFYYHPPGRELAGCIHRALEAAGREGAGVRRRSLALIRPPDLVTALVETAYLSHPEDEAEILDPAVRNDTARAIARAILDYLDR